MTVLERSIDLDAPIDRVWSIVGDITVAAACVPGLAVGQEIDARTHEAAMTVSAGLVPLRYGGQLTVTRIDEDRHAVHLDFNGVAPGGLTLGVQISVAATSRLDTSSRLAIVNRISLDAFTTLFAGPMVNLMGGQLLDGFSRRLAQLIIAPTEAEARER
jgi:carbon monoxide dehydrogenase subunit G